MVFDRPLADMEIGRDVQVLHGVVGVSNQITLKPKVNANDISDSIRHALHRSWFDPKTIEGVDEATPFKLRLTPSLKRSWYGMTSLGPVPDRSGAVPSF